MARVSTYLNFPGTAEKAFNFYRGVFGTEFNGPVMRVGDGPPSPGRPPLSESDRQLVMHVALPILGGHVLMASDATECLGCPVSVGSNVYINLEPDTRAEADRLFNALAVGGKVEMAMADMFWGAYFGSLVDAYGIRWMINCEAKA